MRLLGEDGHNDFRSLVIQGLSDVPQSFLKGLQQSRIEEEDECV